MAYMDQARKAPIAAALKKIVPASWKWSLSVRHHSTLVFTVWSAPVDLVQEWTDCANANRLRQNDEILSRPSHVSTNIYYLERQFDAHLELFQRIKSAMNCGNHDNSDIQTDYFDVGWYSEIRFGAWDKAFVFTGELKAAA